MRVLWFTNIPCGASQKLSIQTYSGGWISELERYVSNLSTVELGVCFYWHKKMDPFFYNGVTYFPILRRKYSKKLSVLLGNHYSTFLDRNELEYLIGAIADFDPDIVHIHGTEDNFGLVINQINIPTVISLQSILKPYVHKYFSGIPFDVVAKYDSVLNRLKLNSILGKYKLMKYCANREQLILSASTHIMGRTDWDRRIAHLLSPQTKYHIQEELLRSVFYENRWDKKLFSSPLRVLSVITNGLYKGTETIVEALALLGNYGFPIQWTVVGKNEFDQLPSIVQKMNKTSYLQLNLKFIGVLPAEDLVKQMLDHDIFCHVSHIENSSNSISEAMMLGMPIIATNTGGTDSLMKNKEHGLLIQDGDPYSLAGSIIELAQNFSQAVEYGANARKSALLKHNPDMVLNSLIASYQDILHK